MADEEPDEKRVEHHDRSQVVVVGDVRRLEDVEVQERERAAQRADRKAPLCHIPSATDMTERRTTHECPDVVDEAVVDERIDTSILEQSPGMFR